MNITVTETPGKLIKLEELSQHIYVAIELTAQKILLYTSGGIETTSFD